MSSSHIIVVARNHVTGAVELPLGDTTLYGGGSLEEDPRGIGSEESVLDHCRKLYTEDWVLSLYRPYGDQYSGAKP